MILDVLVFTLGFLVAGLLALAVLPAVWRRAMRLSGERLSRLVPLSPEEIAADRDHLRAAHAVDLRRTEQKLERAETERADLMAEASRREDRIAALAQDLARADAAHAASAGEAARLARDLDESRAELGTALVALHDASGLADKRADEAVDLRLENQRLALQVDEDRASVAGLETRLLGATTRAEDLARELAAAREQVPTAAVDAGGGSGPGAAEDSPDGAAAAAQAHRREIEHLTHEVQFAHEQATSAERRAAEALRQVERLTAERDARAAEAAASASVDDRAGLRAAIVRLADDVIRLTRDPARAEGPEVLSTEPPRAQPAAVSPPLG